MPSASKLGLLNFQRNYAYGWETVIAAVLRLEAVFH